MEDRLLNVRDAAAYLGVHRSTLDHMRVDGPEPIGPRFSRVGHQIRYRLSELDAYLRAGENVVVRREYQAA